MNARMTRMVESALRHGHTVERSTSTAGCVRIRNSRGELLLTLFTSGTTGAGVDVYRSRPGEEFEPMTHSEAYTRITSEGIYGS